MMTFVIQVISVFVLFFLCICLFYYFVISVFYILYPNHLIVSEVLMYLFYGCHYLFFCMNQGILIKIILFLFSFLWLYQCLFIYFSLCIAGVCHLNVLNNFIIIFLNVFITVWVSDRLCVWVYVCVCECLCFLFFECLCLFLSIVF